MTQATPAAKRKETEYTVVVMDDGKKVEFAGKRKMLKSSSIDADTGEVKVRFDFVNGEYRIFTLPVDMIAQFAAHGAEQKIGDETAGLADIEDAVIAVDEAMDRLAKGQWGVPRKAGESLAGTSVLARALVEHTGKDIATIKAFLTSKTQAQKVALRNNPSIHPIVQRLEAAKTKKPKEEIDTESMLGEIA